MTEARRRPTFHIPGEPLMVTASPLEPVERLSMFLEMSGLDFDEVLVTPIVTTPIPVYPPNYPEEGCFGHFDDGTPRRRWAGLKPEMLWHPLLWLPKRVALRYMIATSEEEFSSPNPNLTVESDDAWAVRVCMETAAAGFYDTDTGEWLDILSAAGLDIEDPDDYARVEAWLDGADDETLAAIDLSYVLDDEDNPDWAFNETAIWMESLQVMLWATHSESLLHSVRALQVACMDGVRPTDTGDSVEIDPVDEDSGEDLVPIDPDRARRSIENLAFFGSTSFSSIHPAEQQWWDWFTSDLEGADPMDAESLAAGPVSVLVEHLSDLRDDWVPVIEESAAALGGVNAFTGRDEAEAFEAANGQV